MNIDSILKVTQKVMCNNALYNNREYFYTPHKKIMMAIIKDITNQSYEQIGKEFKKTWFAACCFC
jgi:chromosomal replication initiation ATPase DnaA